VDGLHRTRSGCGTASNRDAQAHSSTGRPAEIIVKGPSSAIGADWNESGTIILGAWEDGLQHVAATGKVTVLEKERLGVPVRFPQALPGGRAVLYSAGANVDPEGELRILDLRTGKSRRILAGLDGRYLPTGHLVFARKRDPQGDDYTLWAVRSTWNGWSRGARPWRSWKAFEFTCSMPTWRFRTRESLPTCQEPSRQRRQIVWVNREGREEPLGIEPRRWSNPDCRRMAG